jgi:ferric-dicitrate binding protein FerR (iron transport regulator)
MSTAVPPRDGDRSSSSPLSTPLADEDALRRAFLAEYPALAAEARTDLGPDAASLSTKVVEGAFVRAWDARARFNTPVDLHEFLVEDVHHAAARALSRRASAHRLAGHETHDARSAHATTEIDVEQSWAHILHALHGEAHSPEALAAAAAASRHDAAGHIAVIEKDGSLFKAIAVGVGLIIALIGVSFWIDRLGADSKIGKAVSATDARIVASLPAQIGVVTLDDGSRVRLAPESKLTIPTDFGPKLRAVKLEGTASFDVAKGGKENFRVYAGDAIIVAKGTAFTVRSYPADSAVTVVLDEGSVDVRRGKESKTLTVGEGLVARAGEATRSASAVEREVADGWRNGRLVVTSQPLRNVLPQLKRWYNLDISAQQPALLDRPVTLRASLDSSRQAIHGVEQSANVEFGYVGTNMVFKDRTAAPTKSAHVKSAKPSKKR